MTRVCITTQKSLELFGKNKKMKRNMFFLVLLASFCPRDHSALPLKVSCQPPVEQSFYINKMEI